MFPRARRNFLGYIGKLEIAGIILAPIAYSLFSIFYSLFSIFYFLSPVRVAEGGTTVTSMLTVLGIDISAVILNHGNPITLNTDATTSVDINYTISGGSCAAVETGKSTSTAFRFGVANACATGNPEVKTLNCYNRASRVTSTCSSGSFNVTDTVEIWYFSDATDSSSSYPNEHWEAFVVAADSSGNSSNATSSAVELNSLLAIDVTTSTIDYGSMAPSSTTSSTNQIATVKNAGNSSTTLQISGTALTAGANSIATSSQHYATSTFTFGGAEQSLSGSAAAVSGFTIPRPPLDARWATTTPLPSVIYQHSAVVNNGFIYTTGGYDGAVTSTVYFAPISSTNSVGAWATTTPLPRAIYLHSAVVNNGFIYTTGGYDGAVTSTVYFAPISSTNSVGAWATTTPLPTAVYQHSAVVNNGFIYTTGGCNAGTCSAITSTVYFAPISSTNSVGAWATTTPLPSAIYGHSAVVNNGFIYTTGGCATGAGQCPTSTVFFAPISATNSVGAWATTTPLPDRLRLHSAVVNNGFIYTTGGYTGSATSAVLFAPISATNSVGAWATTTPLPSAIYYHSAVVNNGFIYTTGGYAGAATSTVLFASAASRDTYWGVSVPAGTASSSYTGTNTFTAVFAP